MKKFFLILSFAIFYNSCLFTEKITPKLIENIKLLTKDLTYHTGIELYSLKKGKIIYQENSGKLFTPASNTKLFTSLAAIEYLGIDYQFQTLLLADRKGNIYLKGAGDTSLRLYDVEILIKKLANKKIKKIKNFYIDREIFDCEPFSQNTSFDLATL